MKIKKEFTIGITVIIALLVLFFGIDYLKGINIFKGTNYYYATYTNVAGLAQSAPVTVNGYKVGLVKDIQYQYDNPGHIQVELDLNKELKIPMGTKAVIVTDMLGTSTIELHMSTSRDYHNVGQTLIGENATGLMGNVTEDLLPSVSRILPKIDSLLTSINKVVADPALTSAVRRLNSTMGHLETSSTQLQAFMSRMPSVAADAQTTMSSVKDLASDLTAISGQLKNAPIDSTLQNVYMATTALNQLMESLKNPDSTLGLLLNDKGLYDNLNNASASLDSLLRDVKKNPKRYISIKLL